MTEKKALRVQDYIEHMLGAIERIESYVHDLDQAAFERNTLVQDAVIRNFEIIGEAANKIQLADSTFAQRHPQRPASSPANPLPQANAYMMIQRRSKSGEIATKIGNHTFRATGVTAYLKNGGTLENAALMANHASTRTTQLYDRRAEEVTLDEVERILV